MPERPIIMTAESVRAILRGRKYQTRRVIQPQFRRLWGRGVRRGGSRYSIHVDIKEADGNWRWLECPYGRDGTRLWVREAHSYTFTGYDRELQCNYVEVAYRADDSTAACYVDGAKGEGICDQVAQWIEDREVDGDGDNWRPSIHMPRWASRITLVITNIRVERLQDITPRDILAEGVGDVYKAPEQLRPMFAGMWDQINGKKYPWASNPWVWVVEYRRI